MNPGAIMVGGSKLEVGKDNGIVTSDCTMRVEGFSSSLSGQQRTGGKLEKIGMGAVLLLFNAFDSMFVNWSGSWIMDFQRVP